MQIFIMYLYGIYDLWGILDELEMLGADREDSRFMDEDERREILEDAGLNPDDFDDEI